MIVPREPFHPAACKSVQDNMEIGNWYFRADWTKGLTREQINEQLTQTVLGTDESSRIL